VPQRLYTAKLPSASCRSDNEEVCSLFVTRLEHWLLPTELGFLSNLHCDFYSTATSAVDISSNVLTERPYGGSAILYRKSLCAGFNASVCSTYDICFTGLRLSTYVGPLLLLNVYMPTDYNDAESLEKSVNVCASINAKFVDHNLSNLLVIGDFNCQPSSRFYSTLNHLISDNNLVMTDITLLENVFTYCSDSGASTSWIYHVITSQAVHNCVKSINVIYDYTCSDHRPLTVTLCCNVCIPSISNNVFLTSAPRCSYVASDWANADPSVISLH